MQYYSSPHVILPLLTAVWETILVLSVDEATLMTMASDRQPRNCYSHVVESMALSCLVCETLTTKICWEWRIFQPLMLAIQPRTPVS